MAYAAGHVVTAAEYALGQNDWIDYSSSFSLTGSGGNPTLGNSTLVARYTYKTPHTIQVVVQLTIGSSFSVGSGFYQFSLPVAPAANDGYGTVGSCYVLDQSAGAEYGGLSRIFSSTVVLQTPKQSGTTTSGTPVPIGLVGAAFPMIPATSDNLRFSIEYEVA